MRDADYYRHESQGPLVFAEDWWARVVCDQGIIDFYAWLCRRHGLRVQKNRKWGPHISFIKGEEPPDKALWGSHKGPITFWYANHIRIDNGCHAWLDVWSDQLIELRAALGLPPKIKMSYHLTIGRYE
jgi:hypothetical protein